MKQAGCLTGSSRHEAIQDLESLAAREILHLKRHRLDPTTILEVRLPLQNAQIFFDYLGEVSPQSERESLAEIFQLGIQASVPTSFQAGWEDFCRRQAEAARAGKSVHPFDRAKPEQTKLILDRLPKILSWQGESLMRFASVLIFGHSKLLESYRSTIEACLTRITHGEINKLSDLGILENERTFLLHGPLELHFDGRQVDITPLMYPVRFETSDVRRATLHTSATRCLTVENASMLKELAKLQSGALLASSGSEGGYANSAVIEFIMHLPETLEVWHFGDSDPRGFDILRDLRLRTKKQIQSLHMTFRPVGSAPPLSSEDNATIRRLLICDDLSDQEKSELRTMQTSNSKGAFEQESFGRPRLHWPYF